MKRVIHEESYKQLKPYLGIVFFMTLLTGHSTNSVVVDRYGSMLMMFYMMIDAFFQPNMSLVFQWHHALSVWLCAYDMLSNERMSFDNRTVRGMMYNTEWSTMMLAMAQISRRYGSPRAPLLFGVFFALFVWFRNVWMAYVYDQHIQTSVLVRDLPVAGLYALNTHWLVEILEKYGYLQDPCVDMIVLMVHWLMVLRHVTHPFLMLLSIVLGTFKAWDLLLLVFVVGTYGDWRRVFPKVIVSGYWAMYRKKEKQNKKKHIP